MISIVNATVHFTDSGMLAIIMENGERITVKAPSFNYYKNSYASGSEFTYEELEQYITENELGTTF